jgi:hypothetical protein
MEAVSLRIVLPLALGLSLTTAGANAMERETPNDAMRDSRIEETDVGTADAGTDAESASNESPPISTRPAYVEPLPREPRELGCSVGGPPAHGIVAPSLLALAYVLVTSRRRRD